MKVFLPLLDWLPVRATQHAERVDFIFLGILSVCAAVFLVLVLVIFVFCIRYRLSSGRHDAGRPSSNRIFEWGWTLGSLGIFLGFFVVGTANFLEASMPVKDEVEVFVLGKQWMWKIQNAAGPREINEIHVPVHKDVKLILLSQDVIHSFYVPAFRIKQDLLPGRYLTLRFRAEKTGKFPIRCAEYCGGFHSQMNATITVMEPEDYERWLANQDVVATAALRGEDKFKNYGCAACHVNEIGERAPRLEGALGKKVRMQDGEWISIDEDYLRESIKNPRARQRAGYRLIMPDYSASLSEEDVADIIAYIKSMDSQKESEPREEP